MTPLYHITHLSNLRSIAREGSLLCDLEVRNRRLEPTRIGHEHLKAWRLIRAIPLDHRPAVGECVPFFFVPRQPMLYAIHRGSVNGYPGGQTEVVFLRTSAERVAEAGLSFCFTDGNATAARTRFIFALDELQHLDWDVMTARDWRDTPEDDDRKRRRQAEFLVRESLPWELVDRIGVHSKGIASQVDATLIGISHQPRIEVRADWYF
jgi:hypothetical protein